jgi:glycosyltransferase involved in cell wall biosynthesis
VLPSHLEAFSMAPLEAMRLGVPVIYTSRASGPELIDHGRTGLLVDPAKPNDIAAAVGRVVSDPAFTSALTRGATAVLATRFSIDRCIAESLQFYAGILGLDCPDLPCEQTSRKYEERKCRVV